MCQTLAIFRDAYWGLKARKMFWIVLVLSGLVVAAFGCIGVSEKGMTFLFWELDLGNLAGGLPPHVFYKSLFVGLGIDLWLAWVATILALISTAGIFPAFMQRGSIDLVIARPIGRWRLFLTQYAAGLLFVTLQIAIFCAASFLVMGLRGGTWEPGVFLGIPLVVCFFSYLFSMCVLLGVLTRSTLAALLLTILFWALLGGLHTADTGMLAFRAAMRQEARMCDARIERLKADPKAPAAESRPRRSPYGGWIRESTDPAKLRNSRDRALRTAERLAAIHRVIYAVKTCLPKTAETVDLLERTLIRTAELQSGGPDARADQRTQNELVEALRNRSIAWVLGTSLAFELVILALGGWIFSRRDF